MEKIKAKKVVMSQIFNAAGQVIPITVVACPEASDLKEGTKVTVSGASKGRGFAGAIKRWGFSRQPKTHGQSDRTRAPGASGATTSPGRVLKGKRMPGRHGGKRTTVRGLEIVAVDKEKGLLKISGAVPGARGSEIEIRW